MKRHSQIALLTGTCLTLCLAGLTLPRVLAKDVVRSPSTMPTTSSSSAKPSPLDFAVQDIDGKDVNLADYKGKVVMIVNVASKCGYTPQYAGLEKLYQTYKDRGFVILGFPANNFKSQEPGTNEQIKQFCTEKYNVTFPMMSKISVKGDDQAPLYRFLTSDEPNPQFAGPIGWNFTKFLVDRNGQVYARFDSKTKPQDPSVIAAIEKGLDVERH